MFSEITTDQINFLKQRSSCQCCLCVCVKVHMEIISTEIQRKEGRSLHSYTFSMNISSERSGLLENVVLL